MKKLIFSILSCIVTCGSVNAMGRLPLYEAVADDKIETVRTLLDQGTDIDILDSEYVTPLLLAVSNENLPIVQLLLERHANVSQPNYYGFTPLHCAASRGNIDIVQLLLDYDADDTKKATNALTSEDLAVIHHHDNIAQLLKEWPNIKKQRAIQEFCIFARGSHERLGENSPVMMCDEEVLKTICAKLLAK